MERRMKVQPKPRKGEAKLNKNVLPAPAKGYPIILFKSNLINANVAVSSDDR